MNRNKKILFLHGFFASGGCVPAVALREAFAETADVLTPDLPLHPHDVLQLIGGICEDERPDLLVGNSCGSFYAQIMATRTGIPALLGNPYFLMTEFLIPRIGYHRYKSQRANGRQDFIIDQFLIDEFAALQETQFDRCAKAMRDRVWGLFGDNDHLAHFEPVFLEHYSHSFHFPGAHTPTADEVREWYVTLARRMLEQEGTACRGVPCDVLTDSAALPRRQGGVATG